MSEVDSAELTNLQQAMNRLMGESLQKFKQRVTYFVALAIKSAIKPYPGPSHSPVIWPSEKARRYYFAMRRKEGLPLKYTRLTDPWSSQLQNNWIVGRAKESTTLGNRAPYSPWVVSSEYQTEQHKATGWTTDEQAVDQMVQDGTMERIVLAQVQAMVREAFRGL